MRDFVNEFGITRACLRRWVEEVGEDEAAIARGLERLRDAGYSATAPSAVEGVPADVATLTSTDSEGAHLLVRLDATPRDVDREALQLFLGAHVECALLAASVARAPEKVVVTMRTEGVSLMDPWLIGMAVFLVQRFKGLWPNSLRQCRVHGAGLGFRVVWAAVSALIDEDVAAKVQLCS